MSLADLVIKDEYRSLVHNVTKEFYIPMLREANSYKRAVGFFSSSILGEITPGIASLAANGGTIQLVASPYLSNEDIEAIRTGYEWRQIVQHAVLREMNDPRSPFEERRLNLLANLIADGVLDIKIAFTRNSAIFGMYHEKMGLVTDLLGNVVAFSGSMNESKNAIVDNYEVIDVWCSWKNEEQRVRVQSKATAFDAIWGENDPTVDVIAFPALKQEILSRYKRKTISNYAEEDLEIDEIESPAALVSKTTRPQLPSDVKLHLYQVEAIDEWQKKNFRGIFDMATGTGKTFTGLGAVCRLSETIGNRIAVIIVCPYQHLVEQWVEDIKRFGVSPIIGYSASQQKDWLQRLNDAILDQKLSVIGSDFFCFVCTNATFSSEKVQISLKKISSKKLIIVDEAHNFGAEHLISSLTDSYDYRLALSATIERHNDEEGTEKLYQFFGPKCIEYPLERAIAEKKLTRYRYYPILTVLTDEELSVFSDLSAEISKSVLNERGGNLKLSEHGKRLALKRARLVAGASDKLVRLSDCIKPYAETRHILVYCGATNLLRDNADVSETTEEDLRQIDAVTDLLGNGLHMKVSQFTSRESIIERTRLKEEFAAGRSLQALIAIKCLDEGVNIPAIRTAFILASTTNPKEYIQRRGRVLRLFPGKEIAEIYDFVTLPRPLAEVRNLTESQMKRELTLVRNEISRAVEFARLAENMADSERVIDAIKDAYGINDYAPSVEGGIQSEA